MQPNGWGPQPPGQWGPPQGQWGQPQGQWGPPQGGPICARCGQPGADLFNGNAPPFHRACNGLGPDGANTLTWPWILLAYAVTIPFGCTFIGALIASVPYYTWKNTYPLKAKAYNKHVWIGFGLSVVMWIGFGVLSNLRHARH